jgi:hypothetical protein
MMKVAIERGHFFLSPYLALQLPMHMACAVMDTRNDGKSQGPGKAVSA